LNAWKVFQEPEVLLFATSESISGFYFVPMKENEEEQIRN